MTHNKKTPIPMRDFSHSLPMALLTAREAVMQNFRPMLREFGLTEQQWRIVRALMEADHLEISELSARCLILMPSLSRTLPDLERRQLIERQASKTDQRRTQVSLTPQGRDLFLQVAPRSEEQYRAIAEKIGLEDINALYRLLETVSVKLKN